MKYVKGIKILWMVYYVLLQIVLNTNMYFVTLSTI